MAEEALGASASDAVGEGAAPTTGSKPNPMPDLYTSLLAAEAKVPQGGFRRDLRLDIALLREEYSKGVLYSCTCHFCKKPIIPKRGLCVKMGHKRVSSEALPGGLLCMKDTCNANEFLAVTSWAAKNPRRRVVCLDGNCLWSAHDKEMDLNTMSVLVPVEFGSAPQPAVWAQIRNFECGCCKNGRKGKFILGKCTRVPL